MNCFLMQDWLTLRGATTSIKSITQSEAGWLDMGAYQDIVVWLDVREITGPTGGTTGLYIDMQTAPVRDEAYFLSMYSSSAPFGFQMVINTTGPSVGKLTRDSALVPLSRWLRWQITTGGTTPTGIWDVTFRLFIAANFKLGAGPRPMPGSSMPGPPAPGGQPSYGVMQPGAGARPGARPGSGNNVNTHYVGPSATGIMNPRR
jgi:hypothetical protein